MLVGRVVDAMTGSGLQGASINCNTGGSTVSLAQGYYAGVAVAGTGVVTTAKAGYQTNVRSGVYVKSGSTTRLNIQVVSQNASAHASPSKIRIFNVLDPAEEPKPPTQPFAARVSGANLEFNAVFPRYEQPVDIYLGLTIDDGQHSGKLFLVGENDLLVEFTGTPFPWRKAGTHEESLQVLKAISSEYPLSNYTLYSLVTTDSSTFSNYDLSFLHDRLGTAGADRTERDPYPKPGRGPQSAHSALGSESLGRKSAPKRPLCVAEGAGVDLSGLSHTNG
jgi:hypothetical protein